MEIEEQGLVEQLIAHPAIDDEPFYIGFPGAMKSQSMAASLHQSSIALLVNSVPWSDTIIPGLPRTLDDCPQSGHAPPEIDVSGMAPKHFFVTSSAMSAQTRSVCREDAEASAVGELVMNKVQRPACVRLGVHRGTSPHGLAVSAPFADGEPLLAIKPVDPIVIPDGSPSRRSRTNSRR